MSLDQLAVAALLSLSAFLGVEAIPSRGGEGWAISSPWIDSGEGRVLVATSQEIPSACRLNPKSVVEFPMIIHAAHEISVDGKVVLATGDPTFQSVRSFYGTPTLPCAKIASGRELSWRVSSYSQYFARFRFFPRVSASWPVHNAFAETTNFLVAGACLAMSLFLLTIFLGKADLGLTLSVSGSCLFASVYFGACVSGVMGWEWSMLTAHKFADLSIWVALILVLNGLRIDGYLSNPAFSLFSVYVGASCIIIAIGTTGDTVQFGSTLPFGFGLGALALILTRAFRRWRTDLTKLRLLHVAGLLSFVASICNEVLTITGLISTPPLVPIGFLSGIFFFAFAVNERIGETYRERDFLRANLEGEVERKTAELQTAMSTLRSTQAELVQSAKLASLGTLSAGIAHEINNSLNYVNGAMQPLEKLIEKSAKPEDRPKIDRLLGVMKEGLQLTIEIIKSLRSHAGLNQAKFNDVLLREAAASSLAILRTRTRGKIEVDLRIPEELKAFGSVVGLNQVFMNLISNAIDAMPNGGRLEIVGQEVDVESVKWAEISVRDSGCGMPAKTIARIFEPFFTTKDVGSGTGLGLHIVRGEIDRHGGSIRVESEPGKGTVFFVRLPVQNEKLTASEPTAAAAQTGSMAA